MVDHDQPPAADRTRSQPTPDKHKHQNKHKQQHQHEQEHGQERGHRGGGGELPRRRPWRLAPATGGLPGADGQEGFEPL